MKISDREAALSFLTQRINYERTSSIPYRSRSFKLDRMRSLLERLGNPHYRLPVVHVGGTKGKGSTSHMIASILDSGGFSVGLYTSPHLERLEERFLIDGVPCSEQELVDTVCRVADVVEAIDSAADGNQSPTYFEITTAIAMLLFEQRRVDFAVCEVGLGGRLDSTNVCEPLVTVITSISLDHTRQLGSTVEAIAGEKAGIIKRGVPLICGVRNEVARSVIINQANRVGAPLHTVDVDFRYIYEASSLAEEYPTKIDFMDEADSLHNVQLRLVGDHQALNASVAIATIREIVKQGYALADDAILRGMAATQCPARIEVIHRDPYIIVDSAHNVASMQALVAALEPLHASRTSVLVFATSKDKDLSGMLQVLLPHFDTIICTRYVNNPRAVAPADVAEAAHRMNADAAAQGRTPTHIRVADHPSDAWDLALQSRADLVCISGSFFIAAELRGVAVGHDFRGRTSSTSSAVGALGRPV